MKKETRKLKTVRVRGLVIGEGMPKICVPVGGADGEGVLEEVTMAAGSNADIIEWRADFFQEHAADVFCGILPELRNGAGEMPLMFACRSRSEGGRAELEPDDCARLLLAIIETGCVDMVDIELSLGDRRVRRLVDAAHGAGLTVVVSCHDVLRTPPGDELVKLFRRMRDAGADIPKLAVRQHSFNDVLTLLAATDEFVRHAACPVVSMSMSGAGAVSRLLGEVCGSSITYGSMRCAQPGGGSLAVDDLRAILDILDRKN